jgi:hypothetical protein
MHRGSVSSHVLGSEKSGSARRNAWLQGSRQDSVPGTPPDAGSRKRDSGNIRQSIKIVGSSTGPQSKWQKSVFLKTISQIDSSAPNPFSKTTMVRTAKEPTRIPIWDVHSTTAKTNTLGQSANHESSIAGLPQFHKNNLFLTTDE